GSITGGIAYYISYDGLLDTVYNNISSKAVDTANIVASGVETELKIVEAMAQNDIFKTGDLTSQLDFLRREEKRLG
ncbi:MAG: hypothetical protein H5T98_03535, partial [Syntrophomonadaceae bacterium]|nr:hypothetical protein [Syntrophomonadaceae bacterium]